MRRYKKPELIKFNTACARNFWRAECLRIWIIRDDKDPNSLAICLPRPSKLHRIRSKAARCLDQIRVAIAHNKLYLLRYDPNQGFRKYDPATEPPIVKSARRVH